MSVLPLRSFEYSELVQILELLKTLFPGCAIVKGPVCIVCDRIAEIEMEIGLRK